MNEAVIVSTARTGLAKSWKGGFNMTFGATLGAHAVRHAVGRSGLDPAEIEDCIMGGTFGEGTTGGNIARGIALRAGLPVTTGGVTVRQASTRRTSAFSSPRSRPTLSHSAAVDNGAKPSR